MFLVNSRHHHFTAAPPGSTGIRFTQKNAPSSEGTGSFCRVPWPEFSRAPWIIHPTHLCRSAVRFTHPVFRSFSRQHGLNGFSRLHDTASHLSVKPPGICLQQPPTCLHLAFQRQDRLSSCVPPSRGCASTRILTRFPSTAHFCLALGTD